MTDPKTPTPPPTKPATSGRWVRILLILSLGLNLLIVGLAAGAAWRHAGDRGGRDFGFGPLSEAFSTEDRRELREAFVERHPDARAERQAMREDLEALITALRAEPFEPIALEAAMTKISQRNAQLLQTGSELVVAQIKAMDATERAAFADRLEKGMRKRGGRDEKKD